MGGDQLVPADWKAKQLECSIRWQNMSPVEKEAFHAEAASEQSLRENAAHLPWDPKAVPASSRTAVPLSRNAMTSISRARTIASHSHFRASPWWDELGCGIGNADGLLKLDSIDVTTSDKDLLDGIRAFSRNAYELPEELRLEEREDVHHKTCLHGECISQPYAALARKFVWSMARLLQKGSLTADVRGFEPSSLLQVALRMNSTVTCLRALEFRARCSLPRVTVAVAGASAS